MEKKTKMTPEAAERIKKAAIKKDGKIEEKSFPVRAEKAAKKNDTKKGSKG